jgi:predicted DNA-binding transcriptional regulator YafY
MSNQEEREVVINYTNWRGERRNRRIRPVSPYLTFTTNEWHKEACWMVVARDLDLDAVRYFPLKSIHHWEERIPR